MARYCFCWDRRRRRVVSILCTVIFIFFLNTYISTVCVCEQEVEQGPASSKFPLLPVVGELAQKSTSNLPRIYKTIGVPQPCLSDNTLAVVLLVSKNFPQRRLTIQTSNGQDELRSSLALYRVDDEPQCGWNAFYGIATAIPNAETFSAIVAGAHTEQIPVRPLSPSPSRVVTCVSPLVAVEQWHWLIFTTAIFHFYGSFVHFHVHSMAAELLQILRMFVDEGSARVQEWPIPLQLPLDKTDLQVGMHSAGRIDCFLQYKESAHFVQFVELGDLLVPRYSKVYMDDFLYMFQRLPVIASINLAREVASPSAHQPMILPAKTLINHKYQAMYELWPFFGRIYEYEFPEHKNLIRSLPHFDTIFKQYSTNKERLFYSFRKLLRPIDFKEIKQHIEERLEKAEILVERFSKVLHYPKSIEHCLREKSGGCPSLRGCKSLFESITIKCIVAKSHFSILNGARYGVLYQTETPSFRIENGCI